MQKVFAFLVAIVWFVADYFSKQWALETLGNGVVMRLTSWMEFKLAFNKGAAFSLFADGSGWQRWFFMGIAIVIGLWLCYAIVFERTNALTRLAYASILGGAIGNLYDRILHGKVVDFISWHIGNAYWPTFNVADVGICVGVGLLVIAWLVEWRAGSRL
ncbi:Lipoprotein signal peptidase [Cardiobacterium hominis]|uniref:Lipoprotein signal peptidase n=1 Tax=Cardiobacterium hominis TaxID=2718 RepID=A0A1C3H5I0_9GAMM|nr:signal peptidase II [Cardiobacterium hominis]SAM67711.1 Lipoprotein signal peptidase [Cardiobacterium hominis]